MGGSNAKALCVVNKLYPPAKGDAPITEILEKAKIDPAAYKAELEKDGIAEEGYEEEDEVIEKYGEEARISEYIKVPHKLLPGPGAAP
eukprot:TRINITY_DN3240_c0_g2_i3.p1 TRINITY_DN3240_c0_g2~~TRINITY_DN3240_c0_g2_i3.p1  ORF type:complete len:100 (-),score=20.81 TRINITY_DN3240_c0_g2_i3:39-302(-)